MSGTWASLEYDPGAENERSIRPKRTGTIELNGEPELHDRGLTLHPSLERQVRSWRSHPELNRLAMLLLNSGNRRSALDRLAETVIAQQLLHSGAHVRFEVPTPNGRQCDFEVTLDSLVFYVHVKRLDTNRPIHNPRRLLEASSRLRVLERIPRPYVIKVRWVENITEDQLQELVTQASDFVVGARIGDEMRARDGAGREIGGVRVIAPAAGRNVEVTMSLPARFIDQAPRFRKLLHRAYQQFMPGRGAVNVIMIASDHYEDAQEFETALLGTHIERWDAFPPAGQRVAHGRAPDGFWYGQRFSQSVFAGWFRLRPEEEHVQPRMWVRTNGSAEASVEHVVLRGLGAVKQTAGG